MGKQIFQTDNKSRWNSFKWTIRFVTFIAVILIAILVVTLVIDKTLLFPLNPIIKVQ